MVPHGRKVRKNETESKDYENYTFSVFDLIHGGFQKDNLIKMLTTHWNADKNMCSKKLIAWENEISKDRILDVSAVPVFKQYLPQAQVSLFPNVGHAPMLEIPEESAHVLSEFIASTK